MNNKKLPCKDPTQVLIDARIESNLTQKELSYLTGIHQSKISRIESGKINPTVNTLQRLAAGMKKRLFIEFI